MIVVLGAGAWGSALASVLAKNEQQVPVCLWSIVPEVVAEINVEHTNSRFLPGLKLPANLTASADLAALRSQANKFLLAVPSSALISVLEQLQPTAADQLWFATKGLLKLADQAGFVSTWLQQQWPAIEHYGFLSGPSFATEVAEGLVTAVDIAASTVTCQQTMLQYFGGSANFIVKAQPNLLAVQLGGVFKNLLAVLVGLIDALEGGSNLQAACMTKAMQDLVTLAVAMGLPANSVWGLAGLGDLILTCTSNQSRNRSFGWQFGQSRDLLTAQTQVQGSIEALNNIQHMLQLAERYAVQLVWLQILADYIASNHSRDILFQNLRNWLITL